MNKIGERAVIHYLRVKGLALKDSHTDIEAILGRGTPS
jgi:hypothetical protein